jgi:two-component system cell cycle response regulator
MQDNYERSFALALVDPLTGAFNRRYMDAHVPKLIARCRAVQKPLAILMVDLDHFKQVNDVHGHAAGDHVLKDIVNRITNALRPSDLVARLGGEEFIIVMPETDLIAAIHIAERLRKRIETTPVEGAGDQPISVTVSIGAAVTLPESQEELPEVLKRADAALYDAKKTGRNKVVGS